MLKSNGKSLGNHVVRNRMKSRKKVKYTGMTVRNVGLILPHRCDNSRAI